MVPYREAQNGQFSGYQVRDADGWICLRRGGGGRGTPYVEKGARQRSGSQEGVMMEGMADVTKPRGDVSDVMQGNADSYDYGYEEA
jgi:hypothetical protein